MKEWTQFYEDGVAVNAAIWRERRFKRLSREAKLLWFFLATSDPDTDGSRISRDQVSETFGWPPEQVEQFWNELMAQGWECADALEAES